MSKSVIIAGGGLSGLACACLLAKNGARVTLIEQSERLGGRADTEVRDGFHLNLGPHALYLGGEAQAVLRKLDIPHGGHLVPAQSYGVYQNKVHPLPSSPFSLLTTRLLPLRAKFSAAKTLAGLSKLNHRQYADTTYAEWAMQRSSHPAAAALLMGLGRLATYAGDLDLMSADVGILQLQRAASRGVVYIDGGWTSLVARLSEKAQTLGVKLITGLGVEEVLMDESHHIQGALLTNKEELTAGAVILATGPAQAARLAGEARLPALYLATQTLKPVRAMCLDIGLERLPLPERTFVLGLDVPYYLSVHSRWAALAPPGKTLISLAIYLKNDIPPKEEAVAALEAYMDLAQPGWRPLEIMRRVLPAATVSHALPRKATMGLLGRPAVTVQDAHGLYLAGDWVGAEGMLADCCFASAQTATQAILANTA